MRRTRRVVFPGLFEAEVLMLTKVAVVKEFLAPDEVVLGFSKVPNEGLGGVQ